MSTQPVCEHDGSEHFMGLFALSLAAEALENAYATGGKRTLLQDEAIPAPGDDVLDLVRHGIQWFRRRCPTLNGTPPERRN